MVAERIYQRGWKIRLVQFAVLALAFGCSSGQSPMVIHMYNPKTHQALTCSARDQTGRSDSSMLASTVESCAKNLEARGFVREK
jgi:hypothetical protein